MEIEISNALAHSLHALPLPCSSSAIERVSKQMLKFNELHNGEQAHLPHNNKKAHQKSYYNTYAACTQDIEFECCWSGLYSSVWYLAHLLCEIIDFISSARICTVADAAVASAATYVIPITINRCRLPLPLRLLIFSLFLLAVHIEMHSSKHWGAHVSKVIAWKTRTVQQQRQRRRLDSRSANRKLQLIYWCLWLHKREQWKTRQTLFYGKPSSAIRKSVRNRHSLISPHQ